MDDNPKKTIAEAFTKFNQSILPGDAYDFANTELKDVWQAVRDIDSAQRQRQSAQNLGRIEPLLRGLEKYAKVIEVLCNGTPYLPYVWALIKLMVQLASEHRDVFEALLTAYADIGDSLPRFDRYERAFGHNLAFQNVLATVYSGIIDFHQRAYKFFRRRAWHVLFLSLWNDFRARFAGIIDGLKKQRDFVDREAASIDILESKESRDRAQRDIEQRQKDSLLLIETNETILKNQHLEQSKSWLSIKEQDQDMRFNRLCRRRHNGTCVWIMEQAQIVSWMKDDTKNPMLWLCGKPGAGKSVMCSYLVSTLSKMPNVDILPFFCSSEDGDNSCSLVLRTIAFQLLRRHPDLASLISNEFISKGAGCIMSQLRILIPKILETIPFARVVIDGIDETSKDTQKSILEELRTVCLGSKSNCKVLFSSRKEVHLTEKLAGKPQILLDGRDEVNSDIRLYIEHIVKELKTSNQDLLHRIESILVDKANGMFLWVRLVEKELCSCYSDWDLEERVTSLPKGLERAYGRILARIAKECGADLAIRILEWMACSYRPLKVYELLDGIAFRVGSPSFEPRPRMKRDVLNLCRPLIEDEDQSSDTLKFIHFSAKEYILKGGSEDGSPFVRSDDAHFKIGFSCVAYLNTAGCLLPSRSSAQQRAALLVTGLHGLLPYANRFWIDHLLTYCASLKGDQAAIHPALLTQLNALVQFLKRGITLAQPEEVANASNVEGLRMLDRLPNLRILILNILKFRRDTKSADSTRDFEKSAEELSVQLCETDPSDFGILLHHYQATLESLLGQQATKIFPQIQQGSLDTFQETFGAGAFVCRYLHCSRATDGFNASKQRDVHEAAHQRQFRCKYPSCASFSTGFAARRSLNRHNDQYHHVVNADDSLSNIIGMHRQRLSSVTTAALIPPASPRSTTDLSSFVSEQARKPKILFELGDKVAFKQKLPGRNPEEQDWIQGEVVRVIGEGKSRRYDVKDIDPDAANGSNIYKSTPSFMVPIPPEGTPLGAYEAGKHVLALYPETTTFYRAEVKSMIDGGARVVVIFEEEAIEKVVARRFVLDHKG